MNNFEHIRIARSLGRDLDKYLLQIAVAQRRFARWSNIVKLDSNGPPTEHSREPNNEDQQVMLRLLLSINSAFEKAREKGAQYTKSKTEVEIKSETAHSNTLAAGYKECLAILEEQNARTEKERSSGATTTLVLWKNDTFQSMVKDLGALIEALESLFPSIDTRLPEAYGQDIEGFPSDILAVLSQAAQDTDKKLLELANQKQKARAKIALIVSDYATVVAGDMVKND